MLIISISLFPFFRSFPLLILEVFFEYLNDGGEKLPPRDVLIVLKTWTNQVDGVHDILDSVIDVALLRLGFCSQDVRSWLIRLLKEVPRVRRSHKLVQKVPVPIFDLLFFLVFFWLPFLDPAPILVSLNCLLDLSNRRSFESLKQDCVFDILKNMVIHMPQLLGH